MFMQNLEKRMFKKTPAGYIFQFPPSRFRRTDAVLVTAPQKEEILAITRKSSGGSSRCWLRSRWAFWRVARPTPYRTCRRSAVPCSGSVWVSRR